MPQTALGRKDFLETCALRSPETDALRESAEMWQPLAGASAAIHKLARQAEVAMRSRGPILIQGETGSGKGVLARWLHRQGIRKNGPFVDLNCAGLSHDFLESELFGHARGAFTGAVTTKRGLLEVAHEGTLFLDEIGDLDPAVQPKLLKVLEEKRFRRMGEVVDRQVDVILISATNHDLPQLVREGRFRRDLYFRINTFPLPMPPLRQRREDIPLLVEQIVHRLNRALGRPDIDLTSDALAALVEHPWPGNLRELCNCLERARLGARGPRLYRDDFTFDLEVETAVDTDFLTLAEVARRHIERTLREECGRVGRAALRLGICRSTLYQKVKEYRIDLAPFHHGRSISPREEVDRPGATEPSAKVFDDDPGPRRGRPARSSGFPGSGSRRPD